MRAIDAHSYLDAEARTETVRAYNALRKALVPEKVTHVTLVGKVMIGVWGCLPSFDTYFRRGFGQLANRRGEKTAFNRVDDHSLTLLGQFHSAHRQEISEIAGLYTTLAFGGGFTSRRLPLAKVIDMYGFQRGYSA